MASYVKNLPLNTTGRDLLVGDLHGCVGLLEEGLRRIGFDPGRDRVIAVGDLVDRGPDHRRLADLLKAPWFYSVLGNHDVAFAAELLEPANAERWALAGGHPWIKDLPEAVVSELRRLIAALPWVIAIETEQGRVGVVHAEVPMPFRSWDAFTQALAGPDGSVVRERALWERELHRIAFYAAFEADDPARSADPRHSDFKLEGVAHAVHGHTPAPNHAIYRLGNRYWIDCGAYEAARQSARGGAPDHRSPRLAIVDARRPATDL